MVFRVMIWFLLFCVFLKYAYVCFYFITLAYQKNPVARRTKGVTVPPVRFLLYKHFSLFRYRDVYNAIVKTDVN